MKKFTLAALLCSFAVLAQAKSIKTLTVTTTPQMHCANCETRIKGNLRFEKGVKGISTDIDNQIVEIKYDADKTTPEKIIAGFKKFGYEARQLKPGEKVVTNDNEECPNM